MTATRRGARCASLALAGLLSLAACDQRRARVVGTVDGSPFAHAVAGTCTDAWCVSHVLAPDAPHYLCGVWARSPGDAWAADGFGDVLHWNGDGWASSLIAHDADPTSSLTAGHYTGVWGASSNEVWAAGWDGIQHWDGQGWTPQVDWFEAVGIGGTAPNDAWAAGTYGMYHWDGSRWSGFGPALPESDLMSAVWAFGPNDAWSAGTPGLSHWDGDHWTEPQQPLSRPARRVWGSASNDVWAVGDFGVIGHWDGAAWSERTIGTQTLGGIWGSAADDVWVVGDGATILHWDGREWAPSPSGLDPADDVQLSAVWGSGPNDVWVVGENVILHHGSP